MLPQAGTEIKGHKRSTDKLRAACGYDHRQRDFDDLIRILDGELRLITPVDSTGVASDGSGVASDGWREAGKQDGKGGPDDGSFALPGVAGLATGNGPGREVLSSDEDVSSGGNVRDGEPDPQGGKLATHHPPPATQYQLTHDYLVPSLRDWLTRKQRETRKGRAELKLAERAATWSDKRENKQLPTVSEWLSIRTLTESKKWTLPERAIMQRAGRVHGSWWGGLLLASLLIGFGIQQWISSERWKNLGAQTQTSVDALQNNLGPSVGTLWAIGS